MKVLDYGKKVLWALFLVSLPVTSFPHFPPALGGEALVRPLALYPLIGLLILVTLPRLLTRPLSRTLLAFLPFVIVALASTLVAWLHGIEPILGVSAGERMMRALLTLGLGSAYYFTAVLTPDSAEELRFSLRWLYAGFILALLWGTLQVIYVLSFSPAYFTWLSQMQSYVSIRPLFAARISGLAYEPNWFAEQISLLLYPWLFAAVLRRFTVFRWSRGWVTVEGLLLMWASFVLIFTYSRMGLMVFILLAFLSALFYSFGKKEIANSERKTVIKNVVRRMGASGLSVLILVAMIFIAGRENSYFSRLWRYWSEEARPGNYFEYIAFGQRFIYWQTAYNIYEDYPLLGAGLGNFPLLINDYLPERPYHTMPEVLRVITLNQASGHLITPKSLFARLLAETGLAGLATFLAFLVAIMGCVLSLWFSREAEQRYWGTAGLYMLVPFAISTFSTDSFSIPNMWIVFGLITAAAHVFTRAEAEAAIQAGQKGRLGEEMENGVTQLEPAGLGDHR